MKAIIPATTNSHVLAKVIATRVVGHFMRLLCITTSICISQRRLKSIPNIAYVKAKIISSVFNSRVFFLWKGVNLKKNVFFASYRRIASFNKVWRISRRTWAHELNSQNSQKFENTTGFQCQTTAMIINAKKLILS